MTKKTLLLRLLLPVAAMLLLAGVLLLERKGMVLEARGASLALLDATVQQRMDVEMSDARIMVACNRANDTEMAFFQTLTDVLSEMRLPYQTVDISQQKMPDLSAIDTLLYCSQSLAPLENDVERLSAWIDVGGRFGVLMTPAEDATFQMLYRKFGIMEYGHEYVNYTSLRYTSGLLPLWGDALYNENGTLTDYALAVRLQDDCTVHIVTGDELALPLLWERPVGKGRVVVFNTTLMVDRGGRGFVLSALSALEDTLVYPIINAGMVYIDDFPAPQPEGFDEQLRQDYGYDIQGFFRNHWWPDMKQLSWDYHLRYTGVLIETYNDNVTGPFDAKGVDDVLQKYYASELLHAGGEIGLHGYNHMPLCPQGFNFYDDSYITWPSTLAMAQSMLELSRYGKTLFLDANFTTYVPPSNYLSDIGRQTLIATLPHIRVISGLYIRETGNDALIQEFDEAKDGTINTPRITSGFDVDDFMGFVLAQELVLHGVYSHFIHPDDILDTMRGGNRSWDVIYGAFRDKIQAISLAYPYLQFSTASEGAAAVQRFARLNITRSADSQGLTITLSPFYDEAWLALRTRSIPVSVQGGILYQISDGFYWIKANKPVVRILWGAAP